METSRAQELKRLSSSRSIDHMSLDMVDHVPSNIPESSFPARLCIFEDNEAVFRMIMKKVAVPNQFETRTHCVDMVFERINFGHLYIHSMRTKEHLADTWTKGAFTTSQWKSLMRLFDIHPPSNLNVDRHFLDSSCSAVSPQTSHATSDVYHRRRDVDKRSWKEKLGDSSHGVRSAWGKNNLGPAGVANEYVHGNAMLSSEQRGAKSYTC